MFAYSHEKDQNTLKIEFLERMWYFEFEVKPLQYIKNILELFVEFDNTFVEVVEKMKKTRAC